LFYFDYLYGRPNWLDLWLGTSGELGYEGGLLGALTWAVPMLAGTLVYDLVMLADRARAIRILLMGSVLVLLTGYLLSCLSTCYPIVEPPSDKEYELIERGQVASSPVIPTRFDDGGGNVHHRLATLPLLPVPAEQQRELNYWIMTKRVVTPTFVLTATGFCL